MPRDQTPKKDEFFILGSPLGPKTQADLLEIKMIELEKGKGIVGKLESRYGFFNVGKLLRYARVVVLPENLYMF